MAFQFNPAQLLAASTQPSTPVKSEDASTPSSLPDTMRYLAANGPLFQGIPGLPGGLQLPAGLPPGFPLQLGPFPGMPLDLGGGGGGGPMSHIFFDPMGYHPYGGERRKNATRETTAPLKAWLVEHKKNPYPTKQEKILLAVLTKMSMTQVSTWFANARRRLKKEHKNEWSPRNRQQDDDDDLDTVDANERPSSSMSDISTGDLSQQNGERKHESNNNANGSSQALASPSSAETESPKKPKIWSIADISMKKDEKSDSREENECPDEAGSSKKESDESPLAGLAAMGGNPFLAMQQYMAMMQRLGSVPGAGLLPPAFPRPPMPGPAFPPLAIFNPMLLLQQMQQQAAAAAVAAQSSPQQTTVPQLNGSWSEGQSLSPSSSNHSAASPQDDSKGNH